MVAVDKATIVWALIATALEITKFDSGSLQLCTVFGIRCNSIWSQVKHVATLHCSQNPGACKRIDFTQMNILQPLQAQHPETCLLC